MPFNDELEAPSAAPSQLAQELGPEGLGLRGADIHAQNLAPSVRVDANEQDLLSGKLLSMEKAMRSRQSRKSLRFAGQNGVNLCQESPLLAQKVEHDLALVRRAAMLEQIDALPSPKNHSPRGDRNGKLRLR